MESNGTLPSSEEIRFATICGSHANMAARAIMHGSMVHEIPNDWRRAIQDGAEWKVIKAVVWQQFPELVDMVCQSGNTNQSISKQEDEMQLVNKIRQACAAYGGSGAPKWQDVAGAVLRSRPKCGPSGVVGGHTSLRESVWQGGPRTWAGNLGHTIPRDEELPRPPPLETRIAEVWICW